jgi:hypothetical protein
LIFLGEKFVEACRDFPQHGIDTALNPILWMDVQFAGRGGLLRRRERDK